MDELIKRLQDFAAGTMRDEDAQLAFDAADAIEELSKLADAIPHKCECCVGCELEKKNGGCDNAFIVSPQRAKEYLSKPRWIPVAERLPKYGDWVLGIGPKKGYHVCEYRGISHFVYSGDSPWFSAKGRAITVTHWMPLPEPPKEG